MPRVPIESKIPPDVIYRASKTLETGSRNHRRFPLNRRWFSLGPSLASRKHLARCIACFGASKIPAGLINFPPCNANARKKKRASGQGPRRRWGPNVSSSPFLWKLRRGSICVITATCHYLYSGASFASRARFARKNQRPKTAPR